MKDAAAAKSRAESYGQAVQYLDSSVDVTVDSKVPIMVKRDGAEVVLLPTEADHSLRAA